MIKAFQNLLEIQRRSRKKPRVKRYIPYTCHACGYSQTYETRQMHCTECGTIGQLVEWVVLS